MVLLSVIIYGFVLPFLISYPSDFLVGVGVIGVIAYTYGLIVKINNLIKSINQ